MGTHLTINESYEAVASGDLIYAGISRHKKSILCALRVSVVNFICRYEI